MEAKLGFIHCAGDYVLIEKNTVSSMVDSTRRVACKSWLNCNQSGQQDE